MGFTVGKIEKTPSSIFYVEGINIAFLHAIVVAYYPNIFWVEDVTYLLHHALNGLTFILLLQVCEDKMKYHSFSFL